jgi:hypothetical protein
VVTTQSSGNQLVQVGGRTTSKAADLKFANRQLITVGFVPAGVSLPKPPGTTITALLQVLSGTQPVATTTTTVAGATTTTGPTATTTTSAPPATTTTLPPVTTTTTKK